MKPAELEKIVIELGKQGESPAKIGLMLRDKHGIPKAKLLGKRISAILKENKVKIKPEKEILEEKNKRVGAHIAKNKHDYPALRSLTKRLWVLNKLK